MLRISPSSIKCLDTCSFQFYYQYILRGNTFKSPKTSMGSAAHAIFEELADKEKYKSIVDTLLAQPKPNIYSIEILDKLAIEQLDIYNQNTTEWRRDLNKLVVAGLSMDFYIEGAIKYLPPEYEFLVSEPDLEIKGIVDRAAFFGPTEKYPNGYILLRDYKSQAELFTEKELENNIQAATYQWALNREFNLPVIMEFVLLRHNVIQKVDWIGDNGTDGMVSYLKYISAYVQDFDIKKAQTNFAADKPDKEWLCGKYSKGKYALKKDGNLNFNCYARWPTTLYMVYDGDKLKYSTDKIEDVKDEDWDGVRIMKYPGCPRFNAANFE